MNLANELIYGLYAVASLIVAWRFFVTHDGVLRKILVTFFLGNALALTARIVAEDWLALPIDEIRFVAVLVPALSVLALAVYMLRNTTR